MIGGRPRSKLKPKDGQVYKKGEQSEGFAGERWRCLGQGGDCRDREKLLDSGYILKIPPKGFGGWMWSVREKEESRKTQTCLAWAPGRMSLSFSELGNQWEQRLLGEAGVQLWRVSLRCHMQAETLTRQLGTFGGWERGPGWRCECELPAHG